MSELVTAVWIAWAVAFVFAAVITAWVRWEARRLRRRGAALDARLVAAHHRAHRLDGTMHMARTSHYCARLHHAEAAANLARSRAALAAIAPAGPL